MLAAAILVESSFERSTWLLKKLGAVAQDKIAVLTKDFNGLNLNKYIAEGPDPTLRPCPPIVPSMFAPHPPTVHDLALTCTALAAIAAVAEAPLKAREALPTVELCSLLHRRYADFAVGLLPALLKTFEPVPKGEEPVPATRKRAVLRFLVELLICKVIQDKAAMMGVVESLMSTDIELTALEDRHKDTSFPNLSVVVSFLKTHGTMFLPEALLF